MTVNTSRSPVRYDEPPLPLEELLRTGYEAPRSCQPEAMRSFAGWNGIVIDQASERPTPRIGFQRVDVRHGLSAWAMTATHHYRIGLPVLTRNTIARVNRKTVVTDRSGHPEPVHHAWNARHYHPQVTAFTERFGRSASGKRVMPTDPTDALIFGNDDRQPYFPSTYPWNCVGRLEFDTGAPAGSGALVGRDLVLTARHCIPETDTFMMKFVPAYHKGKSTVGPSFFSWVKTATVYEGSELGAWDFALLRLYQPLGDHVGFFGVRTYNDDWDDRSVWAAAGYPTMMPFNNQVPSFLLGVAIDDAIHHGDAAELESENQDNSKGNSGGPLWAVWPQGPYIVGVTSGNQKIDYGPFGNDYQVLNASGKAMVDLVALARIEIDTDIHVNPPHIDLGG